MGWPSCAFASNVDMHVVGSLEFSSSVRSIDWASQDLAASIGLVVVTDASTSLFSVTKSSRSSDLVWALDAPRQGDCQAEAGAESSQGSPTAGAPAHPSLLLVSSSPGHVLAHISGSGGVLAWAANVSDFSPLGCLSPVALSRDAAPLERAVYAHSQNGTLVALSLRDGRQLWTWTSASGDGARSVPESGGTQPVVTGEGLVVSSVVRGCSAVRLVRALSSGRGEAGGARLAWNTSLELLSAEAEAEIGAGAGADLSALPQLALRAIPAVSGSAQPSLPLASAQSPPQGEAAAEAEACALAQRVSPPGLVRGWAASTADDRRAVAQIYATLEPRRLDAAAAPSSNASVVALDERTGEVLWRREMGEGVRCSRVAPASSGELFVLCRDDSGAAEGALDAAPELRALRPSDGELLWSLPLEAPSAVLECSSGAGERCQVVASLAQPVVSEDGVVLLLTALVPQLFAELQPAVCALLRVATRQRLAKPAAAQPSGPQQPLHVFSLGDAPRAGVQLSPVLLLGGRHGGSCPTEWLRAQAAGRPLVLLAEDATLAVALDRSVLLLAPRDACSDVQCRHGLCVRGVCYCEANFLGADCSQLYSPYRAQWPMWIGLGATFSLLVVFVTALVLFYRSFLWVKFRIQMLQMRHSMENRGYRLDTDTVDDSNVSDAGSFAQAQPVRGSLQPRRGSAAAIDTGSGGSAVSLLEDGP